MLQQDMKKHPLCIGGRYLYKEPLGVGGFGIVRECTDIITGEVVAIKTIPHSSVNQESRRLVREVDIMRFLHKAHPHVISIVTIFATSSNTGDLPQIDVQGPAYRNLSIVQMIERYHSDLQKVAQLLNPGDNFSVHIVMPRMKGELGYYVKLLLSEERHGITLELLSQVAVVFAFQMCFGLDYLHKCGVVHRDLKPENVLIRVDPVNPYSSTAIIADFGLACGANRTETFYVCTRYYRPPELITNTSTGNEKLDVWSIGCILYELCTGKPLFQLMDTSRTEQGVWNGTKASRQLELILDTVGTPMAEDIRKYMQEGNAQSYLLRSAPRPSKIATLLRQNWILCTSSVPLEEMELWRDLICSCLEFFPAKRPSAADLCCSPLFVRYNVIYNHNVKQFEAFPYTPTYTSDECGDRQQSLQRDKTRILDLVEATLAETLPEFSSDEDEDDEDGVGEGSPLSEGAASDHPSAQEVAMESHMDPMHTPAAYSHNNNNGSSTHMSHSSAPQPYPSSYYDEEQHSYSPDMHLAPVVVPTPLIGPTQASPTSLQEMAAIPALSLGSPTAHSQNEESHSYYTRGMEPPPPARALRAAVPPPPHRSDMPRYDQQHYVGHDGEAGAGRKFGESIISSSFPRIASEELRRKYSSFSRESVGEAINCVLSDMAYSAHDPEVGQQLRELLNFFVCSQSTASARY